METLVEDRDKNMYTCNACKHTFPKNELVIENGYEACPWCGSDDLIPNEVP